MVHDIDNDSWWNCRCSAIWTTALAERHPAGLISICMWFKLRGALRAYKKAQKSTCTHSLVPPGPEQTVNRHHHHAFYTAIRTVDLKRTCQMIQRLQVFDSCIILAQMMMCRLSLATGIAVQFAPPLSPHCTFVTGLTLEL